MPACLGRRAAIGLVAMLALAGCVEEAPPPEMFAPLTYGYLTKLRLNVANIAIDDSWTPSMGAGEHVESLSPVQPLQALVEMARYRLVASGPPRRLAGGAAGSDRRGWAQRLCRSPRHPQPHRRPRRPRRRAQCGVPADEKHDGRHECRAGVPGAPSARRFLAGDQHQRAAAGAGRAAGAAAASGCCAGIAAAGAGKLSRPALSI
jgi:hypothetical protein